MAWDVAHWANVFAAVSAIGAAVAAIASLQQTKQTAKATEATLKAANATVYLEMLNAYRAADMHAAIIALSDYWRPRRGNFPDAGVPFRQLETQDPAAAEALHGHARRVTVHFNAAYRLYQDGMVSPQTFRLLIYYPGLNVFYDVAAPIMLARNPSHDVDECVRVMKTVVGKYGNGFY
jgi:hypothetical protein